MYVWFDDEWLFVFISKLFTYLQLNQIILRIFMKLVGFGCVNNIYIRYYTAIQVFILYKWQLNYLCMECW